MELPLVGLGKPLGFTEKHSLTGPLVLLPGIPGQPQKNGSTKYHVVRSQLQRPSKEPPKVTASSLGGSYYFIYTFQLGDAITDVDINSAGLR